MDGGIKKEALAKWHGPRFDERGMRAVNYRCSNYSKCLLGYRGDDIELTGSEPLVCPECGAALIEKTQPRTALVPNLISWLTIAMLAVGIWFAWPTVAKWWKKITSPQKVEGRP